MVFSKVRVSEVVDGVAVAAIAGGLGSRFGWWLAAVVAGGLVVAANWARSR